jgi:hypothetical protein
MDPVTRVRGFLSFWLTLGLTGFGPLLGSRIWPNFGPINLESQLRCSVSKVATLRVTHRAINLFKKAVGFFVILLSNSF